MNIEAVNLILDDSDETLSEFCSTVVEKLVILESKLEGDRQNLPLAAPAHVSYRL